MKNTYSRVSACVVFFLNKHLIMNRFASLLFLLALSIAATAKPDKTTMIQFQQQVDGIFAPVFAPDQPGAAVLIMKDGKKLFEQCYGIADMDTRVPVTPKTRFCIASVSKQFSAVAILQLVEKGLVKLSDPLSKFFPEYKADFFNRITLHHILSHTSGIPDARERGDRHFVLTATDVESCGYMKTLDHLNFEPGCGQYEYINPTFQLVYQIVERVTGQGFEQYMKKHIFKPAGMKGTSYFEDGRVIPDMAHGYTPDEARGYREFDYGEETFFATKADGGIYTSVTDFAKWEKALRDNKVWNEASKRMAYTPHVAIPEGANYGYQPYNSYGYGFFINQRPGHPRIVYHTGDNGGFTIYAGKAPDEDVVVLIFSTRDNIDRMGMAGRVWDLLEQYQFMNR